MNINDEIDKLVIYDANSTDFQMYHPEYKVTAYNRYDDMPLVAAQHMKFNARTNQQVWEGQESFILIDIAAIKLEPVG